MFKNGPSKIYGRQPLKTLKGVSSAYSRPYSFKFFKGCLPQILVGPFFEYFVAYDDKNRKKSVKYTQRCPSKHLRVQSQ